MTPKKADIPKQGSVVQMLNRRKKSNKSRNNGYDSEESEGTKALNVQYEREPHEFVTLGSQNYMKLPTIDQARIYLLQQSPKGSFSGAQ